MIDKEVYFLDYSAYTTDEILEINNDSITLKSDKRIIFAECENNYKLLFGNDNNLCIGEADDSDMSLMFYTSPTPTMIRIMNESKREKYEEIKQSVKPYIFK